MKYDAIVIGSGQAGNPLAHGLADLGWSVALIEREHLGGTCVNTGCTPTKTMVARAQIAYYARNAARWGVRTTGVDVDLSKIVDQKNRVVESFRGGHQKKVDKSKTLRLYRGSARFADSQTVVVGGERLEGERIFINTGTRPAIPRIEGLEQSGYLTNATVMDLRRVPPHLIVLGAGYIGLEFGQMFRRFGSRVTIVHRGQQIAGREDPEIAGALQKALEAEGIEFLLAAETRNVQKQAGEFVVTALCPGGLVSLQGSELLVATGRVPNTDDLGLEAAGVAVDAHGYIKVNGRLQTSVPGIWALGDVKGGPAFTHISYNDYQVVWGNLIEGKKLSIEGRIVPYSLFTDPQLGGIGMTEKEARQKGYKLKIGKVPMTSVARAIERDETAGMMKLVVDATNDRILGASILASEGGELVQMLGVLMLANLPYTLLKGAVYIHPTLAEGFWSLMESVKDVE
jgi:pyruvate/2-oxoglutarate dehydrogenase complex dihydrolipoamide dehydrogenase (E3) component